VLTMRSDSVAVETGFMNIGSAFIAGGTTQTWNCWDFACGQFNGFDVQPAPVTLTQLDITGGPQELVSVCNVGLEAPPLCQFNVNNPVTTELPGDIGFTLTYSDTMYTVTVKNTGEDAAYQIMWLTIT
jgi:hypothetical protein